MKKFLVGILSALMLVTVGVAPVGAFDGIHAVSPWLPLDTGPAPWTITVPQNTSAHSEIVGASQADLTWVAEEENSELGTSLETNNLGFTVSDGTVVNVNYELLNGASAAAGSVRLFLYFDGGTSTPGNRPATAPDYMEFAPVGPTNGTLSVTTGAGTIGYVGLVYDTSNGGVEGTVRFTNMTIGEEPVSFLPEPVSVPVSQPLSPAGAPVCSAFAPAMIQHATAKRINATSSVVSYWPTTSGGEVNIRYREEGAKDWQHALRDYPNLGVAPIGFLKEGMKYEYQITNGHGCAHSNWSPVFRSL